ncbi:enoyl-CoA hydratase-related protein [Xenophilus arseniciresistens]|uniref:Enoyl-CoA hydratase-related protein n=1 Tax=Xenophilus arseniciresistens TaxID=1283306 RepID=A0AAE3NBA8_9BURK|nr:enoyl-CoA hydratase-related protein [Xenophilus arseniciresistens]MDA7418501.1 enoyl-CoA hydratase-related protein [Xenophilus arseniciresistens]
MPETPETLVRLQRDGDVAVIALCDSARLNPLSIALQQQLRAQLAEVARERGIRALVLTGEGRGFCVGADLSSINEAPDEADGRSVGDHTADTMQTLSNPLVLDLQALPVPVVCAVNGAAAGAGAALALAGDFTLMASSAYLYFPFLPRLGIVPDLGSTWFLERRAGRARALGAALLDERIGADQAVAWGLAWAQVGDAQLREQALALAQRLARLPAHAVLEARRAFDAAATHTLAEQLHYESERQRELVGGPAFNEGVAAFAGKRAPVFPGRG